jgi:hypothetical protein
MQEPRFVHSLTVARGQFTDLPVRYSTRLSVRRERAETRSDTARRPCKAERKAQGGAPFRTRQQRLYR